MLHFRDTRHCLMGNFSVVLYTMTIRRVVGGSQSTRRKTEFKWSNNYGIQTRRTPRHALNTYCSNGRYGFGAQKFEDRSSVSVRH